MEKEIIHYTQGYGGKYNYNTQCGKTIGSHDDVEGYTIDPTKTTCDACKAHEAWKVDHDHQLGLVETDIPRRLYIEADFLTEDDFKTDRRQVRGHLSDLGLEWVPRVFSEVIEYAWHKLDETWEAVKKADEVYASTSLIPLAGGYTGAPVIFDAMCKRAIEEGVSGKSIYILNVVDNVEWDNIDIDTMKKAFSVNDLYMYNEEYEIEKVDINSIGND